MSPQAKPREKVLNTSVNIDNGRNALPKESLWSSERIGRNLISAGGAQENPDNLAKGVPSVTPRQRPVDQKSESVSQMDSTAHEDDHSTPIVVQGESQRIGKLENSNMIGDGEMFTSEQPQTAIGAVMESSSTLKQGLLEKPCEAFPAVEKMDDDPFPSQVILASDPWALPVQSFEGDDLFTGGPKREVKPDEAGMTIYDMDNFFGQKEEGDPFSYFDHSDPVAKFPEQDKTMENSAAKHSPGVQSTVSSKKSRAPLPPMKSDNALWAVDPFSSSSSSSPPLHYLLCGLS